MISYYNFRILLYELSRNEDKLIYESYCVNNYKNFTYLNLTFQKNLSPNDSPYFVDKIYSYIKSYNIIIQQLLESTPIDVILSNTLDKIVKIDKNFIQNFISIEKPNNIPIEITDDKDIFVSILKHIQTIINNNRYYKGKLNLIFHSKSISDKYHQTKLTQLLEHPSMVVSLYDSESYKFDTKLDEYREKKISTTWFNTQSKNNFYKEKVIKKTGNWPDVATIIPK